MTLSRSSLSRESWRSSSRRRSPRRRITSKGSRPERTSRVNEASLRCLPLLGLPPPKKAGISESHRKEKRGRGEKTDEICRKARKRLRKKTPMKKKLKKRDLPEGQLNTPATNNKNAETCQKSHRKKVRQTRTALRFGLIDRRESGQEHQEDTRNPKNILRERENALQGKFRRFPMF